VPRQCPLHTCQVLKKLKIKIITQWRATSAPEWGQWCFVENLQIAMVFCGESSYYWVGI